MDEKKIDDIIERRFIDVENKAIKATIPAVEKKDKNFPKASLEYWKAIKDDNIYRSYVSGEFNGSYNKTTPTFRNMMDVVVSAINAQIKASIDEGETSYEELKKYTKILDLCLDMLDNALESKVDRSKFGIEFISYLHGSINKYITNNIGEVNE